MVKRLLFYQSWKEITEYRTFDSYQYKSVNVLNGIRELIHDISSYLEGKTNTIHIIDAMKEELINVINSDYVMGNDYLTIKNRLTQCLGKKYDTTNQLKGLKYQLQCFYSELEKHYDESLAKKLGESIDNQTEKQYMLTSAFISRCVDLGWSVRALFRKIDALRSDPTKNESIYNFLLKIINAKKQVYAVFIPFKLRMIKDGKSSEERHDSVIQQLSFLNIITKSGAEIVEEFPEINTSKVEIKDHMFYMRVDTIAHDVFSASHAAVVKLSQVLNILSFFSTIESWLVNDFTFIAYNTESPYTISLKAPDVYKTYEYLDSSSKVYSRTTQLISQAGQLNPLSQKLLSAFSYANLSRASMALEEKYMNIWIAVESLCRSESSDNIIDSILKFVPNASSLRYVYRKVRNFIEDCNRCQVSFAFATRTIDSKMSDKERLVEEVISVFRDKALNSELADRCKCNSLLHLRYIEILSWLSDPQQLIHMVKRHHQSITWHINRLYRIRNEIAHSGTLQEISAVRYTEHLYDYLATIVSEIVRFSENKKMDSIEQIYAIINDNYLEFLDLSSAKKPIDKTIALREFWQTGIISYI